MVGRIHPILAAWDDDNQLRDQMPRNGIAFLPSCAKQVAPVPKWMPQRATRLGLLEQIPDEYTKKVFLAAQNLVSSCDPRLIPAKYKVKRRGYDSERGRHHEREWPCTPASVKSVLRPFLQKALWENIRARHGTIRAG